VDRVARRVTAEKKKDAKKARAHERMRARDALERRHRRQERDGLPREPSPETPDDDDDDDDDEDDDMAACLGLSPDLRLGQGRRASLQVGWRRRYLGPGHQGPGPRSRGRPRGYLTPRPR
jgi:hypothetical protein